MAKLTHDDKMRIQTLHEQGMGAKAIKAAYPKKSWSLNTLKTICRRIDMTGSAVDRKMGSGRPKSARSANNIAKVQQLICSQEDAPGTSKSTRQVAAEVGISQRSVGRIAKHDLQLSSFRRMPVQVKSRTPQSTKRLTRCQALLRRLIMQKAKTLFFTDEKIFYLSLPVNSQNNRVWSKRQKNVVLIQDSSWSNESSSRHTSWCR